MSVQEALRRPDDLSSPVTTFRPAIIKSRLESTLDVVGRHKVLIGGLAGAILLIAAYIVYSQSSATSGTPIIVRARRGDVESLVTAVGNLQPLNTVDVGAQVSGQLKKLYLKIGDVVQKGDLVAEIDSTVASAKVDADSAQMQNYLAQLSDKQSSSSLSAIQADRQARLKSENATSQDIYDSAQAALRSAQAQVKVVQAQITQAQSTLKADRATLGYAKIYAPITGNVSAIPAKEGQTLNANQQAPTILTIADLTTMTVSTQVSEADVPKLHIGMDAYFTTLGDPNKRYAGKLRQVLPTPSVVNNVVLYTAMFDVANPNNELMMQMTAQVFFVLAAAHNVVTVPLAALTYTDASPRVATAAGRSGAGRSQRAAASGAAPRQRPATVTVVLPSGDHETRKVVVGVTNRVDAEIVSGLAAGETVFSGMQIATPVIAARATPIGGAAGPGGVGPVGFGGGGR